MTTVWDKTKEIRPPHTHVFIIGVGAYRYLRGGPEADAGRDIPLWTMQQLTSPSISARKFADWVLEDFHHPDAQLATVELLLSEQAPHPYNRPLDGTLVDVEAATIGNIETAFTRWRDRCNAYEGNVAIFYFCGHGVMVAGDHILLAEDYGANSYMPFANAINFNKMYQGMGAWSTSYQCYFVDACSDVPWETLKFRDRVGQPFALSDLTQRKQAALVLGASAYGESVSAAPEEVSCFTEALIQCLGGLASEYDHGKWIIPSTLLVDRLYRVIEQLNPTHEEERLRPEFDGLERRIIHVCKGPPMMPLSVRFDPEQAIRNAELIILQSLERDWQSQGVTSGNEWKFEQVQAGIYKLHAHFQSETYRQVGTHLWVMPPGPWPVPDPILCEESL